MSQQLPAHSFIQALAILKFDKPVGMALHTGMNPRNRSGALFAPVLYSLLVALTHAPLDAAEAPNILWITAEDIGPELGCYGDAYAETPNLDALAQRSLRYKMAWSVAPVCAPARTAIITGMYPTSLGAEHMRSRVKLPAFVKMYPRFLREAGYYCSNNSKEDFNVPNTGRIWDESSPRAHWTNRAPDQTFFSIFNITTSHESQIRKRPHILKHDPGEAPLPAYHPDTPEVRHDWAQYYDKISEMDAQVGKLLRELDDAGLTDSTIVFFYGDHGSGMPRSKRWPYNSGLQVPLLVHIPERFQPLAPAGYRPDGVSDRLVSFVDLAPTMLSLADIEPPHWMQGSAFLGEHVAAAPKYLFGERGRMDERYDMVRSVTDSRFVYIRNYLPHLIYGQHIDYMFQTPTTMVWKRLYDEGALKPPQTAFWEPKPTEELYDLHTDPAEVINLVADPEHQTKLTELRGALRQHLLSIRDAGFLPEADRLHRILDTTIYEYCHDPDRYPLDQLIDIAELASARQPGSLPSLKAALKDDDSGIRYWGALGVLMLGEMAVQASSAALLSAFNDESPNVRIAAAEALVRFGDTADADAGLDVLLELASPVDNGVYVSIAALNAIDAAGPQAQPLMTDLESLPTEDPAASERVSSLVESLKDHILEKSLTE